MKIIPIQATPAQSLSVVLAGQNCQINLYQKSTGVFLDLYVSNSPVITATICLDSVLLVRETYLGFIGDLAMVDLQGSNDPDFTGFGTRYVLVYVEAADL